ncbi:hypothetical protein ACIBL6_14765 [Streptomyces sp. NPDC050400]|uniref:hypothetical protein n=1 Tax=Streptomyces sp. NPDC050400 TaxID=3365610 RepID=UPI0037AA1189
MRNERLAALPPDRRRQAAALALWPWRAPLLAFELDEAWGIDPSVLESLFRLAAEAPGEAADRSYLQAVAELCTAQLFASEVDPDTVELVQLETIDSLLTLGGWLDSPHSVEVERIVETTSGLANHLDGLVEGSLCSHPWEQSHRQYLAGRADKDSGQGYLATRNSVIESACHDALRSLPHEGLFDSDTGRELLVSCEGLGAEIVATLQWLRTTGY